MDLDHVGHSYVPSFTAESLVDKIYVWWHFDATVRKFLIKTGVTQGETVSPVQWKR